MAIKKTTTDTTKKTSTTKKVEEKKAASKTKASAKGETKAKSDKKEVEKKPAKAAKAAKATAKTAKATATKPAKAKRATKARSRKNDLDIPVPVETEIVDAVRQKPRKAVSKTGHVLAIHKKEREDTKEESNLTMEKYNPEQRSILDGADEVTGPVYRYSDEDLNEFRELIIERLEKARKELSYLQGLITRKDEEGTEDTDNRFNHMEDGSGAMEREQLSQLAGRQVQFISHLESAMVRIENKTYGVCRVTGDLIDKARLRAVPHATLSIEAKKNMRRN